MGKIFDNINSEIMASMKAGTKEKTNALRNLKKKMLDYKTSPDGAKVCNANGGEIPDTNEINIINKYVKELQGDIDTYSAIDSENAKNQVKAAQIEKGYLEVYLPKMPGLHEIRDVIEKYIAENGEFTQKQMGIVIKYVKSQFENVDGSMVATEVKAYINK